MKVFTVNLDLPARKFERFYAGEVNQVWARDVHGTSVQFPLAVLRPYVTHNGVRGVFRLVVGDDHKLMRIEPVAQR
ncbi:MAG: DUF2835 family protein [Pseudomonadales bacterium]